MNILRFKQKALGHHPCKGGSKNEQTQMDVVNTTNIDRRAVLDSSLMVGDGASSWVSTSSTSQNNYNLEAADAGVLNTLAANIPDAMRALGGASAETLQKMGGAIVDLNRDSLTANSRNVDTVLTAGAEMVDKLIDNMSQGYGLAGQAISSFKPTENSNADIGKYAMLAAAAVAAAVLLKGAK